MKSQGAIEYLIILGLIIIVSLIIANNLGALKLPSFSISNNQKISEINQLLNEVSIKYSLSNSGLLQGSAIILSSNDINQVNLTFKKDDDECVVNIIGTNYKHWTTSKNVCEFLRGSAGAQYTYNCSVSYVSPDGLIYKKRGTCFGVYEEVNTSIKFWTTEFNNFNEGTYINTTYNNAVELSSGYKTGEYISKVFDANKIVNWTDIKWKENYYGKEWSSNAILINHLNDECDGILNSGHCFNNTYLDLGNDTSLDFKTNDFSVSLWFKANNISGTQSIIDKGTGFYVDGYGLALMDDGRINFITDGNNNTSGKYYLYSSEIITTNKWYHVVIERKNGTKKLYINNILQGTQTDNRELSNPSRHLFLGKADVDSDQYFNGTIDEIIIFNKALSNDEINNLYERGILILNVSVRSCDDSLCNGENWTSLPVNQNRYFQYKFKFLTNDTNYSPILKKVVVTYNS